MSHTSNPAQTGAMTCMVLSSSTKIMHHISDTSHATQGRETAAERRLPLQCLLVMFGHCNWGDRFVDLKQDVAYLIHDHVHAALPIIVSCPIKLSCCPCAVCAAGCACRGTAESARCARTTCAEAGGVGTCIQVELLCVGKDLTSASTCCMVYSVAGA
jgi:hypothetical protein